MLLSGPLEALQSLHFPRYYAHLDTTLRFWASVLWRVGCTYCVESDVTTPPVGLFLECVSEEEDFLRMFSADELRSNRPLSFEVGETLVDS